MGFEWILFLPAGLALLGYGMIWLANVGQDLINGDGGHQRRFEEFTMDARRRGLSARETLDELDVRTSFAKLRRVTSDRLATMPDTENWLDIRDETIKQITGDLMTSKPQLVKPFIEMVDAVTFYDILYPDQARRIEETFEPSLKEKLSANQDEWAALRIV